VTQKTINSSNAAGQIKKTKKQPIKREFIKNTIMNIKDYLHLYLGCTVEIPDSLIQKHGLVKSTRKATFLGFADYHRLESRVGFRAGPEGRVSTFFIKPILRPLSDMTGEEKSQSGIIYKGSGVLETHFESMRYLLSKHFDLFGLIEAGLAIDKTKLNPEPHPKEPKEL
jgi:hypothetical protein